MFGDISQTCTRDHCTCVTEQSGESGSGSSEVFCSLVCGGDTDQSLGAVDTEPGAAQQQEVQPNGRSQRQFPEEEDEQRRARHAEDAGAVRAPAEGLVGRPTGHQHTHDADEQHEGAADTQTDDHDTGGGFVVLGEAHQVRCPGAAAAHAGAHRDGDELGHGHLGILLDFIIEKQKEEMNRLDATRQYREHQLETANQKMQEVESRTNILIETAHQKQQQSKDLDKAISEKRSKLNREKGSELLNAAVGWATGKSKALKNEIEDLRSEISTHEETIEQLQCKIQTMQSDHNRELMNLKSKYQSELSRKEAEHAQETTRFKNRIAWQNHIIGCLSFLLLKTSDIFRKAVNCIIRLARDYYKPRFDTEQVSDIKKALDLFGDERQSHHAAGDFLYITAMQKGKLDNREQIKARREVENVVGGHYDQQQRRGFSMRR